ncbi:hypothetical protein [Pannonibacter carbonis]|uniref:hypothetical protein n=1 Tax=Pannonibacter carbonis TaxID=2067569 RepID=UPI000D1127C4|nr:hypothetical protein [Pannonibacter carbonis]
MGNFSRQDLDQLADYAQQGNLTAYYTLIQSKGDPYGGLALGVVQNNTFSGITARNYAETFHRDKTGGTLDDATWHSISISLMNRDL